jgi:hypothetical protein
MDIIYKPTHQLNSRLKLLIALTILLLAAILIFANKNASALSYNITPTSACTLPNAITAADTDTLTGSCPAGGTSNTINMSAGTFTLAADLPAITTNSLTINGAGSEQTIIDGSNTYQMFNIESNNLNSTFSNFTTIGAGGVNDTWYSIADINGGGTLNISNVVIRDSTVAGAVFISEPGSIKNTSIDNVRSPNGGAIFSEGLGTGTFNITNTTITNLNFATAFWLDDNGDSSIFNLLNDTIANNHTNSSPAATAVEIWEVGNSPGVTVNLENTILANNYVAGSPNTPDNCSTAVYGGFPSELPTSLGHNISDDATCNAAFNKTGDKNSTDPLLGALTLDHYTYILPITSASPAYHAADGAAAPATDQRGIARPQCGGYDIGAYQLICTLSPSTPASNAGAPNTGYGVNNHSLLNNLLLISVISSIFIGLGLVLRKYAAIRINK